MRGLGSTLATIWRLGVPYFRSEDRRTGRVLLLAIVLIELAKLVISRPVIEGSGEGSFPSGTVAWTLAAAAVCVLLLGRKRWAVAAAVVLVAALSGVIVWERWHYPSDVLGGWLLAAGWVATAWLVLGWSEGERSGRALGEHPADRE